VEIKYRRLYEQGKLGTTVFSPLAGGTLTGKYNDGIPKGSRLDLNPDTMKVFHGYFQGDKKEETLVALKQFGELAKSLECTMAQLAMAWVISNPDINSAITGVTRPEQLVETVKSLEVLPKLTADVQRKI
jgi:aryl-alcohol dehydrogenase-like predicted oxidoreductase